MQSDNVNYCGRAFTVSQMEAIRTLIADNTDANRSRLSRRVLPRFVDAHATIPAR